MKTPRTLLLLGLLTLAACNSTSNPGVPDTQPPVTSPVRTLQSFGLYELNVTGVGTSTPHAVVKAAGLRAQSTEINGLQFTPLSFGTYTDERTRTRYMRASFTVVNGTTQNLTVPTYVPVDTDGQDATVGATPFKQVQFFDGSDASSRAEALQIDTARHVNTRTGAHEIDPDATPLVPNLDTRSLTVSAPAGTTVTRVFQEGWQGQALPAGASQVVTFATRLPMAANASQDPFSFNLVFAVTDNPPPLPADMAAPTVTLTANPRTLTAAGNVTFRADAQDDVGIQDVTFYDGDTLLGTDSQAPYEWSRAYSETDNGDHAIRAVATDTSGKTAQATTTFTVNIAPPTGPFIGSGPATLAADLIRSNRGEGVRDSTARIYRTGDRSRVLAELQTDVNGSVQFGGIPEGTYDLVFTKNGAAGSEFNGAVAKAGLQHRLKIAQYDAQNPTADRAAAKLALLTPTALDADGLAVDWKSLTPGTVMNDAVQLRAYTTDDNPTPLQLKYLMFSLVSFGPDGQMSELRTALTQMDPGRVIPGMDRQDSGQVTLDAAGLQGDVYVQVSALDFNNNRSAYLVPIRLERTEAPASVSAPTGVTAVAYTNSERINYIYSLPGAGTDQSQGLRPQAALPETNSWVVVSWDAPATTTGLTGFRVLRAEKAQGPYTEVAFAGKAQCSSATKRCTINDNTASMQVGRDYYYRVKAVGSNEALSAEPNLPTTHILPPFAPQLLTPGAEQTGVDLLPEYTFKTNAFKGGATGLRFDMRVSDSFTSVGNTDAPPLRLIEQNGKYSVTGVTTDTRDYGKWVTYDPATDVLKMPHDLSRVRFGLTVTPLQANRRYSWLLHRAYAYRLQDPTQPESATNPVVAYSVYSDPDTNKIVPGGVTQSVSTVHHFITRP